jgi:site-specific DNA-cytosine methylase
MVFDQVQADLEVEGYEVQAVVLPACAVNAPHRRDRVWFIANQFDYTPSLFGGGHSKFFGPQYTRFRKNRGRKYPSNYTPPKKKRK